MVLTPKRRLDENFSKKLLKHFWARPQTRHDLHMHWKCGAPRLSQREKYPYTLILITYITLTKILFTVAVYLVVDKSQTHAALREQTRRKALTKSLSRATHTMRILLILLVGLAMLVSGSAKVIRGQRGVKNQEERNLEFLDDPIDEAVSKVSSVSSICFSFTFTTLTTYCLVPLRFCTESR